MKKLLAKIKIVPILAAFITMSLVPLEATAAAVTIESTLGIANQTAGDTSYHSSVNAKVDDVLKLEVYVHNKELANSGLVGKDVNVKISIPNDFSKSHTFSSTVGGSNTNTVTKSVTANTSINTFTEYIPGTAYRKFNVGTNSAPNIKEVKISDSIVTTGFNIGDLQPCCNFQQTFTVMVRVKAPVVSINKFVRVDGANDWKTEITAKPGDKVEYKISFKNEGNMMLNDVVIRDSFPPNMEFVKGSAKEFDSNHPDGVSISDNLINGGVIVGNFGPGINGFVKFFAIVPKNITSCHTYTNIGVIKSKELAEFYNTAKINACGKEVPPPPVTPQNVPKEENVVTITNIPTTPTALPTAGPVEAVAGTFGGVSLFGATVYYKKGRNALKKAYRFFKK